MRWIREARIDGHDTFNVDLNLRSRHVTASFVVPRLRVVETCETTGISDLPPRSDFEWRKQAKGEDTEVSFE